MENSVKNTTAVGLLLERLSTENELSSLETSLLQSFCKCILQCTCSEHSHSTADVVKELMTQSQTSHVKKWRRKIWNLLVIIASETYKEVCPLLEDNWRSGIAKFTGYLIGRSSEMDTFEMIAVGFDIIDSIATLYCNVVNHMSGHTHQPHPWLCTETMKVLAANLEEWLVIYSSTELEGKAYLLM